MTEEKMLDIGDLRKTAERLSRLVNRLVRYYGMESVATGEKEKIVSPHARSPRQHPQSCFPGWLP
jgi:hypothetical protein